MSTTNLFGGLFSLPDTFAYMNNPNMRVMSMEDFENRSNIHDTTKFNRYWDFTDTFYAQRLNDINNTEKTRWFNSNYHFHLNAAEENIARNSKAWNIMDNIYKSGGNVLFFDTETIGVFDGSNIDTPEFKNSGITEIGIYAEKFIGTESGNGNRVQKIINPNGSFVFGIDENQKAWLENVLEKKINGEVLSNTEISAMERMSRYSTIGDHAFTVFKDTWGDKEYTFTKQINLSRPDDITHIRSGIDALYGLYENDRDAKMQEVINYINDFTKNGKQRTIAGHNLEYDVNAIQGYSNLHNMKGLNNNFQYVDSMQALRAYANQNNVSEYDLIKELNLKVNHENLGRLEALTEAITESTTYTELEAHNAYEDSIATARVFKNSNLKVAERGIEANKNIQANPNDVILDYSYIKINKQGNIRSRDIVTIDDVITTGYQTSNQYWKLRRTGLTDFSGISLDDKNIVDGTTNSFVAVLDSANNDGATLIKSFSSESDFHSWLRNSTSIVDMADVDLSLADKIHDSDLARRTLNGFFEYGQASTYKKGGQIIEAGGFADFKRYYSIYSKLSNLTEKQLEELKFENINHNLITDTKELLNNIHVGDNMEKIIKYGDDNKIDSITSFFRSSNRSQEYTAHEVAIKNFDQRKKMQYIFDAFSNNKDFFDYAYNEISGIENNLMRTIAFDKLREQYINDNYSLTLQQDFKYSIDDLNSVSLKGINGESVRLDVSNRKTSANRLLSIYSRKDDTNNAITQRLYNAANDLQEKGILSKKDLKKLERYRANNNPYNLANSMAASLYNKTEDIRSLGLETVTTIKERLNAGESIEDISDSLQINKSLVNKIDLKDSKTLFESATSEMMLTSGYLSDAVKNQGKDIINSYKKVILSEQYFDKANSEKIIETLKSMNYSAEDIEQFNKIFYTNSTGKSALNQFNKNIKEAQDILRPVFYRSNSEESSAFMLLTREKDYAKVMSTLSNLNDSASSREIKEAIEGSAAYFEIPYLKKLNLEKNKIIKNLTGHDAQSVLVKQGENYWRYDTLSLNIYEHQGKTTARIKDQGGSFLTSMRQFAPRAYEEASKGEYHGASYNLNRANIARMADEAAPQMIGTIDGKKMHVVSQKDIDYAHVIALEPGEGSKSIKDVLKTFASDQKVYQQAKDPSAINAIHGIYDAFNEYYQFTNNSYDKGVNKVFDSEPFQHFYQRYMTGQTGGIGSEDIIKEFISNNKDNVNAKALVKYGDKGILDLIYQASLDNETVDDLFRETFKKLSIEANLNAVGSETFAKKLMMYVDYAPQMMNNSRTSGQIRPTYTQRANYRGYRLDGNFFFENHKDLESTYGIHFGDVYTSKNYFDSITQMDEQELGRYGLKLTSENASRRNIIGAVQSISDSELQAQRSEALNYIADNAKKLGLDKDAATKMYNRMMNDVSLYEGKAYVRPSLANQEFFMLGDPKTIKSPEIQNLFKFGTEEEKQMTVSRLGELVGQKVENGTTIGYRYNKHNKLEAITYNGQTIHEFTAQNADELINNGKTLVEVEKQLDNFKIMYGEEKATGETLNYFKSISTEERIKDITDLFNEIGIQYQDKDILTLQGMSDYDILKHYKSLADKYSDLAYDAMTMTNTSKFKTMVIGNNNIFKHLTDMSIDSRWNIIFSHFNDEKKFEEFKDIIGRTVIANSDKSGVQLADNSLFVDHLTWNNIHGGIGFDNPTDTGAINTLDTVIKKLEKSNSQAAKDALNDIAIFERNGIALQSIQRQQMNTFQGQSFKLDARVYQGFVLQGQGNYTKENGAKFIEAIRSNIESGYYDNNIAKPSTVQSSLYNKIWSNIVQKRRGILKPKSEKEMLLGMLDTIEYVYGKFDIDNKNIIKFDFDDVLQVLPQNRSIEGFSNSIFKVDGEFSDYVKGYSNLKTNNVALDIAESNSFYIDLSKFGEFELELDKNNKRKMTGVLLPYQHISTNEEEAFISNSTKDTLKFLRTIQELDPKDTNASKKISEAYKELLNSYAGELNAKDKTSLLSKTFKMKMPSSSGALARDAIVPTAKLDYDLIQNIRNTEYDITSAIDKLGIIGIDKDKVNNLLSLYEKRSNAVDKQIEDILNSSNPVKELNITTANPIYKQYLRNFDTNKNITNTIESAVTVSKQMFKDTEMDTGVIGHQIVNEYFSGKIAGIKNYDSLSRYHYDKAGKLIAEASDFRISNEEFFEIFNTLKETFHGTYSQKWADQTYNKIYNVLSESGDTFTKQKKAIKIFEDSINTRLKKIQSYSGIDSKNINEINKIVSSVDSEEFLLSLNKVFENIGDRYASEVGVLGIINRYPNFNETGTLTVRMYLDNTLNGKDVRFLGPQFSVLQNLDFDGDTEFLKFIGNGGLLANDAVELELAKKQFAETNAKNTKVFTQSLKDSLKSYKYSDESLFKATLMKEIDKDLYNKASNKFINALTKEDREWFNNLANSEHGNKDLADLIFAHSNQLKEAFETFDKVSGSSMKNPNMIKAAIQARVAKKYIGNYSMSNLEVREAMTYMLSLADDADEKKLLQIKDLLFSYDSVDELGRTKVEPTGLLTLLEQQGIDTKHVHDAATLNNSSAWRVGINKLFNNANGAKEINIDKHKEAMSDLIEGAKKVFYKGDFELGSREAINKEANYIINESFETLRESLINDVKNGAFKSLSEDAQLARYGQLYLSGLYEMSTMENAYKGFVGSFRTNDILAISKYLEEIDDEAFKKLINGRVDLSSIIIKVLAEARRKYSTDESSKIFGRSLQDGDILLFQAEQGPTAYRFEGITGKKGRLSYELREFDLNAGKVKEGKTIQIQPGISIKELNQAIKNNPKTKDGTELGRLINLTRPDNENKNINQVYLDSLGEIDNTKEIRKAISRKAGEKSTADILNWMFNNVDDAEFNKQFQYAINQSVIIPGYGGPNVKIGNIVSNIIGTDINDFKRRINTINDRIQYGIESGMITGYNSAKELTREINNKIASDPNYYKKRINGSNSSELLSNYLEGYESNIISNKFLEHSPEEIKRYNKVAQEVKEQIINKNKNIETASQKYYTDITEDNVSQKLAFQNTKKVVNKEIDATNKAIFNSLRQSPSSKQQMMDIFGWNNFNINDNFIIDINDVKIKDKGDIKALPVLNAKIGYGQHIGTQLKDINPLQRQQILDAIEIDLPKLSEDSLEYIAATNTKHLLTNYKGYNSLSLDFTSAESLLNSYKAIHETDIIDEEARKLAQESINKAVNKAKQETLKDTKKKTIASGIKESFKDLSPDTISKLKVGGMVAGGLALTGLAGHALFNKSSNQDVEIPNQIENSVTSNARLPKIRNKQDAEYNNGPTEAKQTKKMKQKKIAPPSLPSVKKNRTIYHDANSGFDFKVSAKSSQKLQEESYRRIANDTGSSNAALYVSRDNSKITDNWLENKFAQLTE